MPALSEYNEAMPHIYAVSDATGTTADLVVRAVLTQFDAENVKLRRFPRVRSNDAISQIVSQAASERAIIVHTLVSEVLRFHIVAVGRSQNVPTIDLMGPLLARMSELLATQPMSKPGVFRPFDLENVQRLDAINFAVRHDDGKHIDGIRNAEIVLVGVSRTGKTPLSIFLAYRGWRVANVPIALGVEPPPVLFDLPRRRVVGLMADPARLADLRETRVQRMSATRLGYADLVHIRKEITYAFEVFERRRDWPLVDVTNKSIEESASEVVALIGKGSRRLYFE